MVSEPPFLVGTYSWHLWPSNPIQPSTLLCIVSFDLLRFSDRDLQSKAHNEGYVYPFDPTIDEGSSKENCFFLKE